MHYRRYFLDFSVKSDAVNQDILSDKKISELLQQYKMIASYPSVKLPWAITYDKDHKLNSDWSIIDEIIKADYPSMYETFQKCMKSKYTIYGNMIIARKEIFNKYCSFLFDVLGKYDDITKKRHIKTMPRVDGYLAEELLWIWCKYTLIEREIYRMEVKNSEIDSMELFEYRNNAIGRFVKSMKSNRGLLNIYHKLGLGYLLIKRRNR